MAGLAGTTEGSERIIQAPPRNGERGWHFFLGPVDVAHESVDVAHEREDVLHREACGTQAHRAHVASPDCEAVPRVRTRHKCEPHETVEAEAVSCATRLYEDSVDRVLSNRAEPTRPRGREAESA